jgi:POT family proton-dependent oligopeptide transporter
VTENYMENPSHYDKEHTPGALGLGQAVATRIYCCFFIFYYVTPIFVAIIADSRLGQYFSLVISVILYCLGIVALTISSVPSNLDKGWGVPGLVVAMFLVGLGGGGVKAILPPFLADQYTKTKPRVKTLKSGEKVIVDYELTLQYIYNLYYWIGNLGSLSWFVTVLIERRYGFTEAYGVTLGLMLVALVTLLLSKQCYVQVPHQDNLIVPQATKIITCAIRNGFRMKRADPQYQFERYHKTVSWNSSMVDELTRGLRGCRVLFTFVTFYVCFDQMQNNLISQAGQLDTKTAPNDLVPALNQVGCIVIGPLIQMGLYPFLHRRKIYLGPVVRITIGFGFIALSMVYATVVQYAIYKSPPCHESHGECTASELQNRPSVWLQAPIYLLMSTGEIFCFVTGLEYAYDHSPQDMKVIVQAISLLVAGIGSIVALALSAVAHDPNLLIFYASLAGAMALTTVIFWLVFRTYDRDTYSHEQVSSNTSGVDAEKGSTLQNDQHDETEGAPMDRAPSIAIADMTKKEPQPCVTELSIDDKELRSPRQSDITLVSTTNEGC